MKPTAVSKPQSASKKNTVTCVPDIVKEFARFDHEPDRFLKHTVTQPNGRSISIDVGYERFLAPEIFFNPEIYSSDFLTPLPTVVDGVIQSSPIDVRRGPLQEHRVIWRLDTIQRLRSTATARCAPPG